MSAPAPVPLAAAPGAADPTALTPPEFFARRMAGLGPFEPSPRLAVGVSGGADSTALVCLASAWSARCGGSTVGYIVDHGLRGGSATEAALTRDRLAGLGIASRILPLAVCGVALAAGPALARRAREARLGCLAAAARADGIVHLLLGHHAGDQAETVFMRAGGGSGPAGLAGMAALREQEDVRVLRPLLDVPPAALRDWLRQRDIGWVEDPSNRDERTGRFQARAALAADGAAAGRLLLEADGHGRARAALEREVASELARRVMISPLGYAVIPPDGLTPPALSALWWMLSGRAYPAPSAPIARIALAPKAATLSGLRMLPAGRLGPGWLLVRENLPPPVPAGDGARWDRFRLDAPRLAAGLAIGALGDRPIFGQLALAIRRTLPALYDGDRLLAVPHLGWARESAPAIAFRFTPLQTASGAGWRGAGRP